MVRLLRRAVNLCSSRLGVTLARTRLYRIVKQDKPAAVIPFANGSWEILASERVNCLSEIGPFEASEGLQRLNGGHLCYVAALDGSLAHYSWVQRSGTHLILEAGMSVSVESGHFWIYHCFTAEWARGNGIYPETLKRIIDDHFKAGYRTGWIYTARDNVASQKGILRAGFGLVKTCDALRVGTHYYPFGQAYQGQ
jgi:hypothetical protein